MPRVQNVKPSKPTGSYTRFYVIIATIFAVLAAIIAFLDAHRVSQHTHSAIFLYPRPAEAASDFKGCHRYAWEQH